MPLVLITADVPATAPYGAIEALRLAGLAVNIQAGASTVATPSLADIAVHKNVYLGDADGNGVYTGTDAGLISRVAAGIDTGFDAHSWTDPVIVADADASNNLTGGDAALVAQKSVLLPTPQIPNLPGIPLTPNGGGSLALDEPLMASAVAIANPVSAGSLIVESTPAASSLPASSEVPASSTTEFCETLTASSETSPAQLLSKSKTTPIRFAILATVKSAADLDSSRTDNHDDSTALATPTPRPIAARAIDNYFSHLPGETQTDATLSPAANTTADNEDVTDRIYEELDTDADVQLVPAYE